jgi:catechol 2,3-dioxygenase-like lactoylglutathione lyase family enzyme
MLDHVSLISARAVVPIMVPHRGRRVSNLTITREAEVRTPIAGAHICFRAPDRAAVDAFHAAALACGGRDDGAPGLRPNYHADYYGAFVLDPDGHRIEAVCHAPTNPTIVTTG